MHLPKWYLWTPPNAGLEGTNLGEGRPRDFGRCYLFCGTIEQNQARDLLQLATNMEAISLGTLRLDAQDVEA